MSVNQMTRIHTVRRFFIVITEEETYSQANSQTEIQKISKGELQNIFLYCLSTQKWLSTES